MILFRLRQRFARTLGNNKGVGVVEIILILVDILIMEKRYIYCE